MAPPALAVEGTFAMVDDKPDDPSPDPERGRRAPPTLDLDAIEISDETSNAAPADTAEQPAQPEHPRSRPGLLASVASAAIVSAIFGAGAAALVVWTMGWPGKTAPAPAPQASAPQVSPAALDALAARLDKVESKGPGVDKAALDALATRLTSVESKAAVPTDSAAPASTSPDPAFSAQLGELEKSVAALRNEIAATAAGAQQTAAALDALKAKPPEAAPPPDLSPLNDRLAKLEAATRTLSAEVAKRNAAPADDPQLRRVVAAALLDASVRSGEPYAAALAAAKPFAANAEALKPLDVFAGTGVPGVNALSRELLALLPKLSPAQETSTTGSGIVDRLQAGAARLVRIERTDAVAGNDRHAVIARATAAAQRNDIAEARRELKTLAAPDRAAVQAWLDKADARDAAVAASRQFATDAMAAFTKPAQ
jgi:hypothetical protein